MTKILISDCGIVGLLGCGDAHAMLSAHNIEKEFEGSTKRLEADIVKVNIKMKCLLYSLANKKRNESRIDSFLFTKPIPMFLNTHRNQELILKQLRTFYSHN